MLRAILGLEKKVDSYKYYSTVMACAGVATVAGLFVAYPLDTIRRRLMLLGNRVNNYMYAQWSDHKFWFAFLGLFFAKAVYMQTLKGLALPRACRSGVLSRRRCPTPVAAPDFVAHAVFTVAKNGQVKILVLCRHDRAVIAL